MTEFHIGQTFETDYPPEAAEWCNSTQGAEHPCHIEPYGDGFRIVASEHDTEPLFDPIDGMQATIDDLDVAVCDLYEAMLDYQEQNDEAICALYELTLGGEQ